MLNSFVRSCNRIACAATVGALIVGALAITGSTSQAPTQHQAIATASQSGNPTGVFGWD